MQSTSILRTSNIYFVLALAALASAVAYGIFQFQTLQLETRAIENNQIRRGEIETLATSETAELKVYAEDRAKKQGELTKKLANILPFGESYTALTRAFDNYFAENDRAGNPIFQSSLRYGQGAEVPEMSGISILPVSMNLEATRDNFFKFLNFVSSSGSLDTGTRLTEIKSIQLNFSEGGEVVKNPKQSINFTVEMNAYYQTPKVAR